MTGERQLKDISDLKVTEIWHDNCPMEGERHLSEDCPGGGDWPCHRTGKNHRVDEKRVPEEGIMLICSCGAQSGTARTRMRAEKMLRHQVLT